MNDRELLELAGKAANVGKLDFDYPSREKHGMYFGPRLPLPEGVLMAAMYVYWNPLESDADAFKLAANLRLLVSPGKHKGDGCTVESQRDGIAGCTAFRDDPCEQMRVAITCVAAEIGKTM